MQLTECFFETASPIRHRIFLAASPAPFPNAILIVAYEGNYRPGAAGRPDAKYMLATANAAHTMWDTQAIVLDLSRLVYQGGDEMEWVLNIGGKISGCDFPLTIITGEGCRLGLQSLFEEEYDDYCVDNLSDAFRLAFVKLERFNACLKNGRDSSI